ncbi:MAG: DNA polymerase III subunit chi [Oxalobacter sp.]|nr:MAG: DNA polymerase III subunit chi [Oxalobacter sp.]
MTRIDFHTNVADGIAYTCRLVRKARSVANDSRIVILVKDKKELNQLDDAMWTFSPQDFLPHAIAGETVAAQSPVILTDDDAASPYHDILINMSGKVPASFAQFERVFEIVTQDASDTEAGRERYGYYRQRGYPLSHFIASQT